MKIPKDILPQVTFAAGPAQGLESVKNTLLKDTFFERRHRNPAIAQNGLYKEATQNINKLLNVPPGYLTLFYHGGATTAMDAALWCLVKDSISGINCGAFSKLWCDSIASRLPKSITKNFLELDYNTLADANVVDKRASLILLTPNETSNGSILPDDFLLDVYNTKGPGTLIAWDTTSCAGARALPNAYDINIFACQKCFGAGGGTSVVILSPRAIARIAEVLSTRVVPYSLDLSKAVERAHNYQQFNTPSTINIFMVNEACKYMLANGGITAMQALSKAHADTVLDYAAKSRWLSPMVKDAKYRSTTTLTLSITDAKIKDTAINAALAATGLPNLDDGLEKYASIKENSLRIACFPFTDITGTEQFTKLCQTLDYIYKNM